MNRILPTAILLLCSAANGFGGGFAFDKNFLIQAPDQQTAELILAKANEYRAQLARQWVGEELEDGDGRTLVSIEFQEHLRGRFNPRTDSEDKLHTLWVVGPKDQVCGPWLERYIAQVVIETKHPGVTPRWALEGISGQHDSPALKQQRRQMLLWFSRSGRWPELDRLLREEELDTADRVALVAAPALIEFLSSLGGKKKVAQWLGGAENNGWSTALREEYQISDVADLQSNWESWVREAVADVRPDAQNYGSARYIEWDHQGASSRSENFTVYAPDRKEAVEILKDAERLREEIAIEWLGEPLPPGVGRAVISVKLARDQDRAQAMIQDPARRIVHMIWITTTPDKVYNSLAHELTHTVLATQFAEDFPIWAHEGIASRRDDESRRRRVQAVEREMAATQNWPRLESLLNARAVAHHDSRAYATAASLTNFLTERADNATLLRFAMDGRNSRWDTALKHHYGINNVGELQIEWQRWVSAGIARVPRHSQLR